MFKKMCMNVVFLCCVVSLLVVAAINYPPLAGAKGWSRRGLPSTQIGGWSRCPCPPPTRVALIPTPN